MKNSTYLAISLSFVGYFHTTIAMEKIDDEYKEYEYVAETFPIDSGITATMLTFYVKGEDAEVGYIDYQIEKSKRAAFIRMFVCTEADEETKNVFFLAAEKRMLKKDHVKTVSFYANCKEEEFYKKFKASRTIFDGGRCMKVMCSNRLEHRKSYYIESPGK